MSVNNKPQKERLTLSPQKGAQEDFIKAEAEIVFYGGAAGCYDKDTEFLSQDGWKFISDYKEGDLVTQCNEDETFSLVLPEEYIKEYCNEFILLENEHTSQALSPEHTIVYWDEDFERQFKSLASICKDDTFKGYIETISSEDLSSNTFSLITNENTLNRIPSQDGFKYCFTVPSGMLLMRREDKIFISGNSGKSHALLMEPLKHIKDPNYNAVFFRRTTAQLEGSLWPEAKKMYGIFKGVKFHERKKTVIWPSGAKFKFDYMDLDKHADLNHQGLQYSAVFWDEFTHYSLYQFMYLRTRLRSAAQCTSYMKCSMNPDRDHFVFDWVEPFLLQEDVLDENGNRINEKRKGCPDKSLDGKIRYFLMIGDKVRTSWVREDLEKEFPHMSHMVSTYTFISGTIEDNPILEKMNPSYRHSLENQSEIQKQRLRYGNWLARPEGSGYFMRQWCDIVTQPPLEAVRIRSWDIASSVPSDINPNPDWTAGVKMSKGKDGYYYIEHAKRVRDRPAGVKKYMLDTAIQDGTDVSVTVPQDPAAAGKAQALEHVKMFSENGFTCHTMSTGKDKITRFAPFSALAEQGLVRVVEGSWNEEFFAELEAFLGDGKQKDDFVDATSDAFIKLAQTRYIPTFTPSIITKGNPRFMR